MQPTTSAAALQNLQSAQSSQQSPDQILQGENQSLGVNGAEQQVSGLRQAITSTTNLLNNVAPSVYGRTGNSLVTDAQAGKQIQNESAPIQSTLSGQNTALSNDQSSLSNLISQASTLAGLKQQGQNDTLTNLENIYKDLYGQEQDKAAGSLEQQKLAEQVREANLSAATSSAKASTPSAADLKQQDMSGAAQFLQQRSGGDGHVSQSTWNAALAQWNGAGYNTTDFVNQYKQFINQKYTGYHGFD